MDDNTEKIFKLLKVNSTEDTINEQQKLWNPSIEDLSKVEDILRCNSEDIPATKKDKIATIILLLEKHADEVKSHCEKILQSLPEHRGERGRTHKYQDEGSRESGYSSTPTSEQLQSTHEDCEKPERIEPTEEDDKQQQ